MNLISETHHSCERREHAFMVFREYTIISPLPYGVLKITKLVVLSFIFIIIYKDCVKTPYKNDAIFFLTGYSKIVLMLFPLNS